MDKKQKILVLCGPTATGKTALGIKFAKKYNGEIISADSRQVYKGMDIGTGKDFQIFKTNNVKVWLYDVVQPDYQFSVADYVKCANLAIDDIYKRGKLPIIVGGTGLYLKGLIDGIGTMGVPPDWKLRKKLSNCSIVQLLDLLKKLDLKKLESMNHSDRNNPRRLIRAIELAGSNNLLQHASVLKQKTEVLWLGLTASFDELYKRIDQRVEKRIKNGMELEVKELLAKGYNFTNSVLGTTMGYKQSFSLNKDFPDTQKWKFAEHAYARRQMTWFKKNKRINWFNINNKNFVSEIVKLVDGWYNKT